MNQVSLGLCEKLAKHQESKLEPVWSAIVVGSVVGLFVLNALPSPAIQFLHRIKAVTTQQRLDVFQDYLEKEQKTKRPNTSSMSEVNGLRFLKADVIALGQQKHEPVLSTNHCLPQRVLAQVTFVANRRFKTEEIQLNLERITLTNRDNSEVKELRQQLRMAEWRRSSAQHLIAQIDSKGNEEIPFLPVSTNRVGTKDLRNEWQSLIERSNDQCDRLVEQLRNVMLKSNGFIAVAGKPQVLPRIASSSTSSSSSIIAFFTGSLTSALFFFLIRSVQSGRYSRVLNHPNRLSQRMSYPGHERGARLAQRLEKLGIPCLGAMKGVDCSAISNEIANDDRSSISRLDLSSAPTLNSTSSIPRISRFLESTATFKAVEWLLLIWISIAAVRFFADDMWRSLAFQSPLTGLARLIIGIA